MLVVGCGAIGGYAAYAAQKAGHEVILGVRQVFDQLVVETEGRLEAVDAPVLDDPARCRPADWVLLATKAHQTAGAAGWLAHGCGPPTRAVVVLQNGIDHERRVAPYVTAAPVLPGIVLCSAERLGPGRIRHHGFSAVEVPDRQESAELAAALAPGPMDVRVQPDFVRAQWRKLLQNLTVAPLTALTGRRMAVMARPDVADLALCLAREAVAVGQACGVALCDDDARHVVDLAASLPADMGSSLLFDCQAGRPTEVEYLTGAVVSLADQHQIPVPLNRAVLTILRAST